MILLDVVTRGDSMKNLYMMLDNHIREIEQINEELETLPEGYLIRKRFYYYHVVKDKQTGITRNIKLTKQLCRKRYLLIRKIQLENNIKALTPADLDTRIPRELIASLPKAYQNLPESYFYHPSIEVWLETPQSTNNLYLENAVYTYNGINFRSLAERIIAEHLDKYGLLFRYDSIYKLNNNQISPDFFIKNPFNNKTVVWEHFGAFHKEKYADSMNNKMDRYINHGYSQLENLIATYQYHIRKPERIQNLIEQIIL